MATNNKMDSSCYRGGMAEDIRANILKSNMTREDVINILGRPDSPDGSFALEYVLGMCSGLGVDYDNLEIYFDHTDRFSNAVIRQH